MNLEGCKQSHVGVQDDMLLSSDFLTYMRVLAPLLEQDPTLWCISSWNDNGAQHLDWKTDRLVTNPIRKYIANAQAFKTPKHHSARFHSSLSPAYIVTAGLAMSTY